MATAPLSRRIRRVLSWHRRPVAAVLAGLALLLAVRAVVPAGPATVPVVVTARAVPAGHRLDANDVRTARLPAEALPSGAVADPAEVVDRLGSAAMPAGQVLTSWSVVGVRQAGAGRVIAPLRLADAELAALLAPGDVVGVVAADPQTGRSSVVAADVRVVTVPEVSDGAGGLGSSSGSSGTDAVLCLVSVPTAEAATLAGAAAGTLSVVWGSGAG